MEELKRRDLLKLLGIGLAGAVAAPALAATTEFQLPLNVWEHVEPLELPLNVWHFISVVSNGDGFAEVYVNGKLLSRIRLMTPACPACTVRANVMEVSERFAEGFVQRFGNWLGWIASQKTVAPGGYEIKVLVIDGDPIVVGKIRDVVVEER